MLINSPIYPHMFCESVVYNVKDFWSNGGSYKIRNIGWDGYIGYVECTECRWPIMNIRFRLIFSAKQMFSRIAACTTHPYRIHGLKRAL